MELLEKFLFQMPKEYAYSPRSISLGAGGKEGSHFGPPVIMVIGGGPKYLFLNFG